MGFTCDVAGTYLETSLRRRRDVLMSGGNRRLRSYSKKDTKFKRSSKQLPDIDEFFMYWQEV